MIDTRPPEGALAALAALVAADPSPLAECVRGSSDVPALGLLAAAGPLAGASAGVYALAVEAIYEGHLLHYATPRILRCEDADLALLAGDYLYARGLETLAQVRDIEAIRELADLVSLCAQASGGNDEALCPALWLAGATAVGAGCTDAHVEAKLATRESNPGAAAMLWQSALASAARYGIDDALNRAAETVGFRPSGDPPHG